MTKVHPNATAAVASATSSNNNAALKKLIVNNSNNCVVDGNGNNAVVLTVWKKSLLLNCNGFTVFDTKGNLVFRVDNYVAANRAEIVLMDAAGRPLLTIRRKRLSLGDNWLVYDGESAVNPRFTVRKQASLLNTRCLARVSSAGSRSSPSSSSSSKMLYEVEGSYGQRCCAVYDEKRRKVAEIKRKEAVGGVAFGVDVFRLVVQPEIDTAVAMALVILLDQMFGSTRRLSS